MKSKDGTFPPPTPLPVSLLRLYSTFLAVAHNNHRPSIVIGVSLPVWLLIYIQHPSKFIIFLPLFHSFASRRPRQTVTSCLGASSLIHFVLPPPRVDNNALAVKQNKFLLTHDELCLPWPPPGLLHRRVDRKSIVQGVEVDFTRPRMFP